MARLSLIALLWIIILSSGCIGPPQEDIADGTMRAIQEKYPDDKALGYALGDLRGIWKITWTANH